MATSLLRAAALSAAVFATACTAVGPDYTPVDKPLDHGWQQARASGLVDGPATDEPFWHQLGDPLLTQLVEMALAGNLDLRAAYARLESVRALRGVAAAGQLPTLDAGGSYTDRKESRNTPFGRFIPRTDIHALGVDAAWELDLWGRVRRSIEAAERDLDATDADVQGARLTIATEVVATYVELRANQRRLQIARANLALQERTLGLVQTRLDAGLAVERDRAQAATNVESTRSRLPSLEAAAIAAHNRLDVLLGHAPGELPLTLGAGGTLPALPPQVAVGVPADLVRRRPDVRAAERRFAAAVARVGVGEAERYPTFTLNGTLGLAANSADDLFQNGSDLRGFGPSVRWNLFDNGRLKQRVKSLQATAEAAQLQWEQVVLLALEEAENAMTRFVHEQARRGSLQRAATEAGRAVQLAQSQYRAGLSDFQAVIDSERTVAAIEDDLVASEAAVTASLVSIWKALGGGMGEAAPASAPAGD